VNENPKLSAIKYAHQSAFHGPIAIGVQTSGWDDQYSVAPMTIIRRQLQLVGSVDAASKSGRFDLRQYFYITHIPLLILVAITTFFYFDFTAEDAYITYRYSENLVNTGSLVYNAGEPINAMTSPLHAVLSAALFYVTGQTVLSNKIVALLLLLSSAFLVWHKFRGYPEWQLLALILVLTPPAILLWTFGGLETPILLFLATIAVLIADRKPPTSVSLFSLITFLAGLAFLTRYDSVLFFAPVVLHAASKTRAVRSIAVALVVGAMLPLAWLALSVVYYGDLLPTSFYVKTPNGNWGNLALNGIYIGSYLLFVGIIPVLVLAFALLRSRASALPVLYGHFKSWWWMYVGLFLELLYGLTMATHHMMFSFRFFVPYLPSAALVVVDLVRRASETREVNRSALRSAGLITVFLLLLTLFQIYQIAYTYDHSVNGIALVGEYRSLGIRDYRKFIHILQQEAIDIEEHWDVALGNRDRHPRILTYAAGMLPYTFRASYIYEKLVSYRHCFERHNQGLFADYLHILAPRQGTIEQQLPKPEAQYTLISSYQMSFDGSPQEFLVFYNPNPQDHNLTATISEPCQQEEQDALLSLP
jgi:arabinofuranosyltransferase